MTCQTHRKRNGQFKALATGIALLLAVATLGGCGEESETSTDAAKRVAAQYECEDLGWRPDLQDGPNGKMSLGSCSLRNAGPDEQVIVRCNDEADSEFDAFNDSEIRFTSDYEDFFARCVLDG